MGWVGSEVVLTMKKVKRVVLHLLRLACVCAALPRNNAAFHPGMSNSRGPRSETGRSEWARMGKIIFVSSVVG